MGWSWRSTTHSTQNLPELVPPGVAVHLPWSLQLLWRFWGAWISLAMILKGIKGKWSSRVRPRLLPLHILSSPGHCRTASVTVGELPCPAEGGQLLGLPTPLPQAGAVLGLVAVQRGSRAVCCGCRTSSFLQARTESSRALKHTKLLTLQCQCGPRTGCSLGIMEVLETKLYHHFTLGQTQVFICG